MTTELGRGSGAVGEIYTCRSEHTAEGANLNFVHAFTVHTPRLWDSLSALYASVS